MSDSTTRRVSILDGAVGTELSRRGFDTHLPLWSAKPLAEHPEAVTGIHREFLRAGCQVLTTATFRTHERSLAAGGWAGRGDDLNRLAVACAREAIAGEHAAGARVAGSIAPLEDCFRPDLVPDDEALATEHARQAASLAEAGCDLLLVETMATVREARAAVAAAAATGKPTWCSFVTEGAGLLLSGEPLDGAARAAREAGAEAVLVNCVPVRKAAAEVARLRAAVEGPVGAYGNIGHDREVGFRADLMLAPEEFAAATLAAVEAGATIVGGCCGTEPRHLAALAASLA